RKKTFSYDALGFLERTTEGDVSQVQICDVEGHIIEQWTEEASGRTENRMRFFYDDEGRKERAIRLTSQGEAEDFFAFDGEGRLVRHIDPHGSTTQFNFSEEKNDLGQRVQQKIVVDALGNTTQELCDAMNRPVLLEKRDHHGEMISREELFYDRSGNRAKRVTFVFDKNRMIKQISASWKYDTMGRMIQEVEDEKKSSTITYDVRGRVKTRTLADGTLLSHSYDCIDRLTELKSSDGTVHHLYFYKQGNEPSEIQDLIQNITLLREYNLFGELIQEMSSTGTRYNWEYDEQGRTIKFILPDLSSILYKYTGNHLETVERASPGGQSLYNHHYLHFDQNGHVSEEVTIHRAGGIRTTRDLLERPISYTSLWLCHRTEYGPTNLVTKTANSLFGNKTYVHDALNQLEKEGETVHQFDSIGNPINCVLDRCNQISSINSCILKYDDNGNPKERQECDKDIFYTYDALGRLTSITHPQAKRVLYHYDPLSRLQSKEISIYKNGEWQEEAPIYFIYDQEKEIGTMDAKGRLRELKVLGLGIRGEIGAAVAIELQGKTYAPLHDFQGNIIALVSSKGEIVESYEISAFGKEKLSSPPLNPWRFSSKRAENGLIFFGKRFYDPSLGRWLTPDPTGFIDGPNLYVFVLNNPLSRLDLFGLSSEYSEVRLEVDIADIQFASPTQLVPCRVMVGESSVNWVVSCGYFYKMQYSDEELSTGKVNIFDHFHELFPKEGAVIGVMSIQNGICTSTDQFAGMYQSARNMVHEGTFFIGMHNTSKGFFSDFWRAATELCGKETSTVAITRQFVGAWTDGLHKYNPELGWLHIAHSEAGLIYRRAYEGLLPEQKERVQQHLYFYSLGSAQPVPKNYASSAINVYSEDDFVTRMFGAVRAHKPEFDIHFIPCRSSSQEKVLRFIDHGFMGKTYQGALDDRIYKLRTDFGFFNGQTR
ncbi:MAG: RHS repeat domain-containing protein, partial [Chlamydiales bacterium]